MPDRMDSMTRRLDDREPGEQRALLVGAEVRGGESLFSIEDSLDELEQLALTAGLEVVGREQQRVRSITSATYIGSGKVEEIRQLRDDLGFGMVIFDDELSPAQLRNLETALETQVVDRTALILDIFAMHARSREGALQVELAQYAYRLPRLTRQWLHLSRQGVGGVGLRGPGETQLEVDRREIGRRMAHIRRELEGVRLQRGQRRGRRQRRGMATVAIVGYTNAGKSTLLNRLSGSNVLVEDALFATLDPTTRRASLPSGKEVLFTDTVGFIQKLPTQLVAAFRATMEELSEADILVHVVDVADPGALQKVRTVEHVLSEIDAGEKPVILALNKVDLIDPETELAGQERFAMRRGIGDELSERYERVVPVSARQGVGIDELSATIERILVAQMVDVDTTLPYSAGDLMDLWHRQGIIDSEEYGEEGIHVRGKLPGWIAGTIGSRR